MGVSAIAYLDPRKLDKHRHFSNFENVVHVCATKELQKGMTRCYQRTSGVKINGVILSFRQLADLLFPEWSSPTVLINQFAGLSEFINVENYEKDDQLRAFRRNQLQLLRTMRVLEEAGITPADVSRVSNLSADEHVFLRLWNDIRQRDKSFKDIQNRLVKMYRNSGTLRSILQNAVNEIHNKSLAKMDMAKRDVLSGLNRNIDRLVLHGFYFITPLQQHLFTLFKNAGIELIFLNCYDSRYEKTFSHWKLFINEKNGWINEDQWKRDEKEAVPHSIGDWFSQQFEEISPEGNNIQLHPWNKVSISSYTDFGSYLEKYELDREKKRNNERVVDYYSTEDNALNDRLREYFPDDYDERHLLSYPFGRLLFELHAMWDEQKNDLILTERALFECFASGWLSVNGIDSRNYLGVLEKVIPYFNGCTNFDSWTDRLDTLIEVKSKVQVYNTQIQESTPTRRFHQMMSNPFDRHAYLRVSDCDLTQIRCFLQELSSIARQLFLQGGKQKVTLGEHFDRLQRLLLNKVDRSQLHEVERDLIDTLLSKIKRDDVAEDAFLSQDLAAAIMLYLSGNLQEENENEDLLNDPLNKMKVNSYDNLDSAPLFLNTAEVHLCCLNEKSLPSARSFLPWPLTKETRRHLGENHVELRMLELREASSKQANRFLFHIALAFTPKIHLSWIREWKDEILSESTYLLLMKYCPALQVEEEVQMLERKADPVRSIKIEHNQSEITRFLSMFPKDAFAEYVLCPRRFYYSYVTQESPSFISDYHHQMLFRGLYKNAKQTFRSGMDFGVLNEKKMMDLYQQWLPVLKQFLSEEAFGYMRSNNDQIYFYEEKRYIWARVRPQFLVLSWRVKDESGSELNLMGPFWDVMKSDNIDVLISDLVRSEAHHSLMAANPSELCRFCPHSSFCPEAKFSVDDN